MRIATRISPLMTITLTQGVALADADNNVEWDGVSHLVWQDLRPIVPMASDSFSVRFQAYRGDLTSAQVIQNVDGSETTHAASVVAFEESTRTVALDCARAWAVSTASAPAPNTVA